MKIPCPAILATSLFLTGCIDLASAAPEKERYLLAASRPSKTPAPPNAHVLGVRTFAVAQPFAAKALVVRTGPQRFASDYYHELFVPPADAVTAVVERWLMDAGIFAAVVRPGSPLPARFRLEGDLRDFHLDLMDPARPEAVVALQLYLLDERTQEPKLVVSHAGAARKRAESGEAAALVAALDQALVEVLTTFEAEIMRAFARR